MAGAPEPLSFAASIDGVRTEFLSRKYADRTFLIITQFDKIGMVVEARVASTFMDGSKNIDVETLMGVRDDPMAEVFARQLVEHMPGRPGRALLLGLGFKKFDAKMLRAVAHVCRQRGLL